MKLLLQGKAGQGIKFLGKTLAKAIEKTWEEPTLSVRYMHLSELEK